MSVISDLNLLYEIDNSLWLEETVKILRAKQFAALDLENLIEELEDLGSEKRHQVESLLEQVIRHLLLLQYWTAERNYNEGHWRGEIAVFRNQLKRKLTTNLRNHPISQLDELYQNALESVQEKTLGSVSFPSQCPYTLEQILTSKWLPDYQD
jgi:hypothetical protein